MEGLIIAGVGIGLFILIAAFFIGIYNRLVAKSVQVDNAWSQIDVQLKRRYDLIPNLVETVKGYAAHERDTLEAVVKARQQAMAAHSVGEQAAAENMLTGALRQLFALSEAYPQLKANENFMQLQEELTTTENKISYARQHYNDSVGSYNTSLQQFPGNIVGGMFNFKTREFFEIQEPAHRETPQVKF